ncbi:MAG TPA: hemolysin family protein [Rhodocyclaceae bacterium]|nr:hemolysin family protein [Rhodocyclaceae bacterium]
MDVASQFFIIFVLIALSAWLSISEISLAASRKIKLRLMAQQGNAAAEKVLRLQDNPGHFFTVVQIGLNAVAIMGGIVGESALAPALAELIGLVYAGERLAPIASACAFALVTSLFVLFADLVPKRLAMTAPEKVAVVIVRPMQFCVSLFMPLVWLFDGFANWLFRLFKLPNVRPEDITSEEIVAMADAGAQAGVLLRHEHQLIANVFELDARTVTSAMTARDSVVYFTLDEAEESIRAKLADHPHGKFPVCEGSIDHVLGYVDSKDVFARILSGQKLSLLADPVMREALVIPDTLTLFEALERFRAAREDFALIVNEYALIVGLLTLQDVMNTVMGELGSAVSEELIVKRDEASWLIDGLTPVEDVMQALGIESFEGSENYETIAGFMMYRLRKVPRRTDAVVYRGFKFEVVDIDNFRIDQLLVTRAADEDLAPGA